MFRFFSRRVLAALSLLAGLGLALALVSNALTTSAQTVPAQVQAQFTTAPTTIAATTPGATATAAPVKTATPPPGIGDEYLALGDSVGYGMGAPFPEQSGYAGVFYDNYLKRVQPNLFYYKNFAIPGETSASFISRSRNLSQLDRAIDELDAAEKAGRRVSPITLSIGGNDMLDARGKTQEEKNTALEKYDANLQTILSRLTARTGGKADLIVTTYYNPYAYNTRGEDEETAWVRRFNETITKRAQEYRAWVADFFTPISGKEKALTWIGQGDIHPNSTGYALLAAVVWRATSYDGTPPTLVAAFVPPQIQQGPLIAGQRLAFKVRAQDNFISLDNTPGAGSIAEASVTLDGGEKTALTATPARFSNGPSGSVDYSYVLDTTVLASGKHVIRFEAVDQAGNTGRLEISFEVA